MAYKVRSPRLLKKRRNRIASRLVLIMISLIALIVGSVMLLRMSFWQIKSVHITGNAIVTRASLYKQVQADLFGSYIQILPKSNILLFPKRTIEHDIEKLFPRIESARISMTGLQSIEVTVTERIATALWCQDHDCYFMDKNGFIFDNAPEFNGNVYMIYRGEVKGGPPEVEFTSPEEFVLLTALVEGIKAFSLSPTSVSALGNSEYEMTLSGGEVISFSTRMPAAQTLSNLSSLLSDPKLALRSGTGLSVSSLDLRYGNKVFFKKKGQ